jgi:hypothetical protein
MPDWGARRLPRASDTAGVPGKATDQREHLIELLADIKRATRDGGAWGMML